MYNYSRAEWKNDVFDFNSDKITVDELLNVFLECCSSIDQVFELETTKFFDVEKVICDIVNESDVSKQSFSGGKIYPTQVKRGNNLSFYGGEILNSNNNHFYRGYASYDTRAAYDNFRRDCDTYFMIDLQDVWKKSRNLETVPLNYRENCKYAYPNIFIGMKNGHLSSVISSVPKDKQDFYGRKNDILSAVDEKLVEAIIKQIKDNASKIEGACKTNDKTQGITDEYQINDVLTNFYSQRKDYVERRKQLLEYATGKMIGLDNVMYIRFELKDYEGTLSKGNVILSIYDKEKNEVDRIDFSSLLEEPRQSKFVQKNRKYDYTLMDIKDKETKKQYKNVEKLLKYKTSRSAILPFMEIINDEGLAKAQEQKRLEDQKKEYQRKYEQSVKVVEQKAAAEQRIKEEFKENQHRLVESVQQIEKNQLEIPSRDKQIIDKQSLCDYSEEKDCFVIKPEFKDNLKYFILPYDLDNVDMTYTDLRLVSLPSLDIIKDHNLEGCKLSGNMGLLGAMKNYAGYNFVNAELYCREPIHLRGARINSTTVRSLNKEYMNEALEGSIMDQDSINFVVENGEDLGLKDDVKVQDVDGQEVVLHIPEKRVENVEAPKVNADSHPHKSLAEKLKHITSEEAVMLVAHFINEGKLSVDSLTQLVGYAQDNQNQEENINKGSHKK